MSVRVAEPELVLRLTGADPGELIQQLHRSDADLLRQSGTEPGTRGGSRIGIVDPTARRLSVARRVLAKAAEGTGSWQGAGDVWFSARPLLHSEPGARLAVVFPGLEAEFDPRCADVAERFGLREPAISDDGVLARARSVTGTGLFLQRVLRRIGLVPDGFAGHSVGEWTAMIAAGMYADGNDRDLLERFGPDVRLPEVDFLALGCSAAEAARRIAAEPEVALSHDNAPRQSIVCGPPVALDRVARAARADGVVVRTLPFRSGFHAPALRPFLPRFERLITESVLGEATPAVWSATTGLPYPVEPTAVRELFVRHLVEPVRFRTLIEAMYTAGFRLFVQAGPGQLTSFVTDTLGDRPHLAVSANSSRRSGMAQLRRMATALWVEGADLDPTTLESLPAGTAGTVVAEFDALLAETREAARAVLAAARTIEGNSEHDTELTVSLDAMPYLRDHRFFCQPQDWPDEADRRPVVPATTLVELAIQRVRTIWPDEVAVAVRDARFDRWLIAAPAQRVPITMNRAGATVSVRIGNFASLAVELADRYPAPAAAELSAATAAEPEWAPPVPAAEIYRRREMFHGPGFQGLSELRGLGVAHIRGEIVVPSAPGALLDNAGQLLGCWLMATETERLLAFPRSIREISFHGEPPPRGSRVDGVVRVATPDPAELVMDADLGVGGRVWARVRGWCDVRLDCDRRAHRVYAFPRDNRFGEPQPGGWTLVEDRWPGVAARAIFAGVYLGGAERAEFDRHPLREQRHWLLGRIAAKDAAREWLSARGVRPLFPAELVVTDDGPGQCRVRPARDPDLPELRVAVAWSGRTAVALARPVVSDRHVSTAGRTA